MNFENQIFSREKKFKNVGNWGFVRFVFVSFLAGKLGVSPGGHRCHYNGTLLRSKREEEEEEEEETQQVSSSSSSFSLSALSHQRLKSRVFFPGAFYLDWHLPEFDNRLLTKLHCLVEYSSFGFIVTM